MKKEIIDAVEMRKKSEEIIDATKFGGDLIHVYLNSYGKLNIKISNYSNYTEISEKELINFKE